jgi:hypothetical protein
MRVAIAHVAATSSTLTKKRTSSREPQIDTARRGRLS